MIQFFKKRKEGLLFQWYSLTNLPSLWFWGVKVEELSSEKCSIKIRYSWGTKNPFQSIYFSALAGAGELATGLLVQRAAQKSGNISMLVVKAESFFLKKATGKIIFTCIEGDEVIKTFEKIQNPGETAQLALTSIGLNENNEEVARFTIHWSLKKR